VGRWPSNRLTTIVGAGGIGSVTFVDFARVERPRQACLSRAADLAHINSLLTTFAG
jgi:hypothetical protein